MKTYQVAWFVTIDADSEHEAAEQALVMQRDPESIATVFHVRPWDRPSDDYMVVDLEAEVESLRADAEQWRAYKARKDAVIAAGMGRKPLRNEAKPDTYAVINKDGEVEYSAPWEEACHDHIKDMQDVHPAGTVSKWKVRGIKILPVMKEIK